MKNDIKRGNIFILFQISSQILMIHINNNNITKVIRSINNELY